MSDRQMIPTEQAIAMLADGEYVHTFRNPGAGMLVGADWKRSDVVDAIREHGAELSGDAATSMGHGLALHDGRWLFIATKPEPAAAEPAGG